MKLQIPKNISEITPYPPGKPLEELEREYGIRNSIKLASNENPWGPSPRAIEAVAAALSGLHRYPDGSSYYLVEDLARRHGVETSQIVMGNGSNELIEFLVKAFVREGDEVITSHPSFLMYQKFVQIRGGVNHVVPLKEMAHDLETIVANITGKTRLIFLDNPNNPTGTALSPQVFDAFLQKVPEEVVVVLDEAYVDFLPEELRIDINELLTAKAGRCAVVGLRTFSKVYGLSGLRVGYGIMHQQVAACLHKVRQPFNINLLGQVGARAALLDEDYYQATISRTRQGLEVLAEGVSRLGCTAYPSYTNFFLVDVGRNGNDIYQAMLYEGVIVRSMASYGFTTVIRVTVGTEEENLRFLRALEKCLAAAG